MSLERKTDIIYPTYALATGTSAFSAREEIEDNDIVADVYTEENGEDECYEDDEPEEREYCD